MIKKCGFSLLEMILVIVLTVILTGAVFLVYLTGFRVYNAGEDRSNLRTEMFLALEEITRIVTGANNIVLESANRLKATQGTTVYRFYLYNIGDPVPSYDQNSYDLRKSVDDETYGSGATLATAVQPNVFSYNDSDKIVTVDLTATKNNTTVHMRTKIKPRNL